MNTPRVFTVLERRPDTHDTVTLTIGPSDGQPLPGFTPGQFNMLYSFGAGEVPISFSGMPSLPDTYTHTLRVMGKATAALAALSPGDQLGVRGPFGRGWPMAELRGKHVVVVAGGLGLAPLQPVLEALAAQPEHYAGSQLFYGGRRPQELLYTERLAAWAEQFEVQLSVDQADANWQGHIGVITQLLASSRLSTDNTVALVCGPEIMMRFTVQALQQRGLADSAIYLSMERNMHCAIGHCGHCQWGPNFVCKDGPVFCFADIAPWFFRRAV